MVMPYKISPPETVLERWQRAYFPQLARSMFHEEAVREQRAGRQLSPEEMMYKLAQVENLRAKSSMERMRPGFKSEELGQGRSGLGLRAHEIGQRGELGRGGLDLRGQELWEKGQQGRGKMGVDLMQLALRKYATDEMARRRAKGRGGPGRPQGMSKAEKDYHDAVKGLTSRTQVFRGTDPVSGEPLYESVPVQMSEKESDDALARVISSTNNMEKQDPDAYDRNHRAALEAYADDPDMKAAADRGEPQPPLTALHIRRGQRDRRAKIEVAPGKTKQTSPGLTPDAKAEKKAEAKVKKEETAKKDVKKDAATEATRKERAGDKYTAARKEHEAAEDNLYNARGDLDRAKKGKNPDAITEATDRVTLCRDRVAARKKDLDAAAKAAGK